MSRAQPFRSAADVLRAIDGESRLSDTARTALTLLAQRPGPGVWSRIRHVRAGRQSERLDALWSKVAPLRTRTLKPQEAVRRLARGHILTARVTEQDPSPSTPRDAWDLVSAVLALYPTAT
jgi:hypothetical protein